MAAFDSFTQVQPVLDYAARHLDDDLSLAALAEQAGISPFHLHRVFSAAVGESPKQLTLRLRLEWAAVLLLTTRDSVLDIALGCGFQTHESFTRAFQRRFRIAPRAYRQRGFAAAADPEQHAEAVRRTGLCVSLYRISRSPIPKEQSVSYTVTRQELAEQPVLLVRRRVKRSDIGPTIAEVLSHIFAFAQQHAIPLSGHPLTRYPEIGPGLITMEACMRISTPPAGLNGSGEVEIGTLPAGPAAVTVHTGPYETLGEAYAAVEQWMESQGAKPGGAPWESYITDPGENPDPATWKTEIFWPLAK